MQGCLKTLNRRRYCLTQAGGRVTLSDVSAAAGERAAAALSAAHGAERVAFVACDVTKADEVAALWAAAAERFGRAPDVLVNNAGVGHLLGWRKCIEVNLVRSMSSQVQNEVLSVA